MEINFESKTALVTGAGSGIGRDLVKRLSTQGAKVIAVSQTRANLDSLLGELEAESRSRTQTVSVDLANWKETERKLANHCKTLDFLVNSAGYSHTCPIDQVPEVELDKVIDINLKAAINLIRLAAPGMKDRKSGVIVNVSSVAGLAALDSHVAYAASKAALDMVTKVTAKELGPFNVRVNSVNPTVVWTQMGRMHWVDPMKKGQMMSKIPMDRFAEVREVVEPIVFLLSEQASMINGITMPIDGGFVAT